MLIMLLCKCTIIDIIVWDCVSKKEQHDSVAPDLICGAYNSIITEYNKKNFFMSDNDNH